MQATLLCFLLLGVLACHSVSGDLRYRGNAVHPDYPGQCYYEELRQPIPTNQSYKPINRDGRCESIFCRKDFVLEIRYCGRHNLQPNATCSIESDMRRAYPACCPRLVCQTDSNFI
ncbi:PREDICTED: uncharacterized protein LOC108978424 [Bactrocera latifrons]|uniref:Uncharacterized protein LOC109579852 n=2 Tax=Bactrocera TaxID=47832 RepID=A0ABM3JLY4_BACDO|nr:PREDICTED: uncharacterized protein LOC108978424 [Bactrocera latifrons]XP_049310234.1 uncharacterized protein LOC109579852 [Bactrocera dorsalis]